MPLSPPSLRWQRLALLGILLVAIALRVWGIAWGMQGATVSTRPHPDEWTIYYLVQWFGTYHSLSPCPVVGQHCFFDWGMTFPYFSYLFHLLTLPLFTALPAHWFGQGADMGFIQIVLAARIFSALISTATVYVVYRIGLQTYGSLSGLIAALCAALSCLLVQIAHFGSPDSTTIFLLTLTLLAVLSAMDYPTLRAFLLVGLLWGLATGSEYHMGLLILPITASWFLGGRRSFIYLGVACLTALLTYLLVNIYSIVDFNSWLAAMEHTLRIRTVDSGAEYGNRWDVFGSPWLYVVHYALGYGVGYPLTLLFLAGVVWALVRRERGDIVLLCWLIPYFILVSLSPAKFMRYSAPLLPVLLAFSGRLVADVLGARERVVRVGAAVLASCALLYSAVYDGAYVGLFSVTDARYEAAQWVASHAPAGTFVAYEQLPNGLINMPYFGQYRRFRPCFTQFNPGKLSGAQRYLITDNYDLEEHPRFSELSVHAFRQALASSTRYHSIQRIDHVPSILGFQFPIAGSPHDWRYPSHVITVYAHHSPALKQSSNCFPSLAQAIDALYPKASSR